MNDLNLMQGSKFTISASERRDIDQLIPRMIAQHKDSREAINLMTMEAVSLATSVATRSDALEQQGFFTRCWRNLTGQNQQLSARNQNDLAKAQYLAQGMLTQLADQNLMTFEMVETLSQKINLVYRDHFRLKEGHLRLKDDHARLKTEVVKLFEALSIFFSQIRDRFEKIDRDHNQLRLDVDELRRDNNLLRWNITIEHEKPLEALEDGRTYSELPLVEKLICLANDFFCMAEEKWNSEDEKLLKEALKRVGLDLKEEIAPLEIFSAYQKNPALLKRYLQKVNLPDVFGKFYQETPLMTGFAKLVCLEGDEHYLVETIQEFSKEMSPEEIELTLMTNYVKQLTGRDLRLPKSTWDILWDLIGDLLQARQLQEAAILEMPENTQILQLGEVFHDTLKDGSPGPEMVEIPAGSFQMGDIQGMGADDEKPVHIVTIAKPFAMGKYPVTFEEYDHFARVTSRNLPNDERWGRGKQPVINVSWNDAVAYCEWLSGQTGKRYRLPSEAEWEYAARAGNETAYWWGNKVGRNRANCSSCGSRWDSKQTAPVGSFKANPFGLHDMLGNVWEWVQDCWHENYTGAPTDGSAWLTGGDSSSSRVVRGGSWYNKPSLARAADRDRHRRVHHSKTLGFRLARDL